MSDERARTVYAESGLGESLTLGVRPGVLVVDFTRGFTEPGFTAGCDLSPAVAATARLLAVARAAGAPVVFTAIAFDPGGADGGVWPQKFPALRELVLGGPAAELDPRLQRRADEPVVVKKGASAFFGTNVGTLLVAGGVDTVVLCGATTSGCVRATAVDLIQHGFPALVPRECVGDRAAAPHEANLFDIQAKYADVTSLEQAITYIERAGAQQRERNSR